MKLNALAMENARVSANVLLERVAHHYTNQFISQIYIILGSADFLGNPVGLFNNLCSGVVDVFYEPIQGVIVTDRPQDLGIGIARVCLEHCVKAALFCTHHVLLSTD